MEFSHLDKQGRLKMVDVGEKVATKRVARAEGFVALNRETLKLLQKKALPKGDVLTTAKIAGIMAAKRTAELIPLCHPLNLTFVDLDFQILEAENKIRIESRVETTSKTGVEMEALVAVNVAMLTIYDMCKAVQKDIILEKSRLIYKEGGKSGVFKVED